MAMDKGIKQLRGVISLYRQTTEMLITDFIADEVKHVQNTGAMCGEVFLEIDAFLHPIIGELDGNIRGRLIVCLWWISVLRVCVRERYPGEAERDA